MIPFTLLEGLFALAAAVALGTVAHESLHAAVLRAAGVPVELQWIGDGSAGGPEAGTFGALASVRLRRVPGDLSARTLRVASLSPLVLATPLLAVALGLVPDPFDGGRLAVQLGLIGWLACALPSPQDFSLFWHAEDVIDGAADVDG